MTDDRLPLAALLAKAGDGDFPRDVAETVLHADRGRCGEPDRHWGHERTGERLNELNGFRDRTLGSRP